MASSSSNIRPCPEKGNNPSCWGTVRGNYRTCGACSRGATSATTSKNCALAECGKKAWSNYSYCFYHSSINRLERYCDNCQNKSHSGPCENYYEVRSVSEFYGDGWARGWALNDESEYLTLWVPYLREIKRFELNSSKTILRRPQYGDFIKVDFTPSSNIVKSFIFERESEIIQSKILITILEKIVGGKQVQIALNNLYQMPLPSGEDLISYIRSLPYNFGEKYNTEEDSKLQPLKDVFQPLKFPLGMEYVKASQTFLRKLSKEYLRTLIESWGVRVGKKDVRKLFYSTITNPYSVLQIPMNDCQEICDKVFHKLQVQHPSDKNCGAILRFVKNLSKKESWSRIPLTYFQSIGYPDIINFSDRLNENFHICVDDVKGTTNPCLYLKEIRDCEEFVSQWITELKNRPIETSHQPIFTILPDTHLDAWQQEAVANSLNANFSIIYGPAGSGKTTVLETILKNFDHHDIGYACTSFTNRAVRQMRIKLKSMGPKTMHSMMLKAKTMMKEQRENGVDQKIEPWFKVLIIDEISMISTVLLEEFVKIFGTNYRVIIVGDINQLRPLDWGLFYKNIFNISGITLTELKGNHRTDESAKHINHVLNQFIEGKNNRVDFVEGPDLQFFYPDNEIGLPIPVLEAIKHCKEYLVISPTNAPLPYLNRKMQEYFRSGVESVSYWGSERDGDGYKDHHGRFKIKLSHKIRYFCLGDKVTVKIHYRKIKDVDGNSTQILKGDDGIVTGFLYSVENEKHWKELTSDIFVVEFENNIKQDISMNDHRIIRNVAKNEISIDGKIAKIVDYKTSEQKSHQLSLNPPKRSEPDIIEVKFDNQYTFHVGVIRQGVVNFKKKEVNFTTDDLTLNYASTCHRAQGGEWEKIVFYSQKISPFITREMIYTSVSRTSKQLLIVADKNKLEERTCYPCFFDEKTMDGLCRRIRLTPPPIINPSSILPPPPIPKLEILSLLEEIKNEGKIMGFSSSPPEYRSSYDYYFHSSPTECHIIRLDSDENRPKISGKIIELRSDYSWEKAKLKLMASVLGIIF